MKKRYYVIDIIRGITIVSMILYHSLWDAVYIYKCNFKWYDSIIGRIWQQSIAWSFVFISGFCWSLSRNKIKNGLKTLLAGILITLVTLVFMPQQRIIFGVLTMLGSCMIIMWLIERIIKKINPMVGICVNIILFLFTLNISNGYIGLFGVNMLNIPKIFYTGWIMTYIGFPFLSFWSMDYYGVIPWIFMYISGYYVYKLCERKNHFDKFSKVRIPILEKVGKHSLVIYMIHQPLIYIILGLVFYIINSI